MVTKWSSSIVNKMLVNEEPLHTDITQCHDHLLNARTHANTIENALLLGIGCLLTWFTPLGLEESTIFKLSFLFILKKMLGDTFWWYTKNILYRRASRDGEGEVLPCPNFQFKICALFLLNLPHFLPYFHLFMPYYHQIMALK